MVLKHRVNISLNKLNFQNFQIYCKNKKLRFLKLIITDYANIHSHYQIIVLSIGIIKLL